MDLFLIFLVSIFSSFVGVMVGGGGLIVIPFLIFLGLPPTVAIASNRFGALGLSIGGLLKYLRSKQLKWNLVIPLSFVGVLGGVIGPKILLSINQVFLKRMTGIIILFILVLILVDKSAGIQAKSTNAFKKVFGYLAYFVSMIWGGLFGGGYGTLVRYTLIYFFGCTLLESAATTSIPGFLMGLTAVVIYASSDAISYSHALVLLFGMLLGGYLGAGTALVKGNKWVKIVFALVVIVSAVKLLFF